MKNIIFIAPPAAGKGTQSDLLVKEFGYKQLSTGDMLRRIIDTGSDLGLKVKDIIDKGDLVSDDIMINLINEEFTKLEGKPFILDGFPRTINQAKNLEKLDLGNYVVVYLDISKEDALKRIMGRLTCKCGKSYNLNEEKLRPKVENVCDNCGSKLVKRNDDNEEAFKIRFDNFLNNTKPLLEYYKMKNKLKVIDVNRSFMSVYEDIRTEVTND